MNGLDLFSGIGGIGLGLNRWVRTVAYCEQNRYAQSVLLSRMRSGEIDRAPIWDDVQTLNKELLPDIDIIFGGFPCQDISAAGNGAGLDGKRSGLFFEIVRLIEEIRPTFVFLENVAAIRTRGLDRVCFELASMGYDLRWTVISASSVGAPHQRNRWFLLAYSDGSGLRDEQGRSIGSGWKSKNEFRNDGKAESLADASGERFPETRELRSGKQTQRIGWSGEAISDSDSERFSDALSGRLESKDAEPSNYFLWDGWTIEPDVGRVVNGLPYRVDRIRCLGNAVVPIQVKTAFERLIGL